ncbi:MlaD family protein [Paraconexibacter sp.]|uniref:MlaD family protein n=1 Tax=Paraconexibacter sp. TaxID=2949640 RepID=UPI00356629EB
MSKGRDGFAGHLLTVALFTGVFVAWCGFILYQAGALPSFNKPYEVKAQVASAALLTPGARVTVAGVEVGSVTKVERADPLGPGSRLTLDITDDRVTPLPTDSRLQIRTRSQVGENYVSIDVGKEDSSVPSGGSLAPEQADQLVDVDQVLSVLSGPTKQRARTMLRELGTTLAGRGKDLNRTLSAANPVVRQGSKVVSTLHRQRTTVAQLVDQLGRVSAAVGERGTAIESIAYRGTTALQAIADRDAELASSIRELPSTLASVRRASTTVGSVSGRVTPVVTNLADAVRRLRPAVEALTPAARDGRALIASLSRANPELDRLLRGATRATKLLPNALPKVRGVFCQLNPALRHVLPYKDDLLESAFHLGSGSNSYDATGHLVRLVPLLNEGSLSGAPPAVLEASKTLLASGAFLPQKLTRYSPFLEPGEIGKNVAKPSDPSSPATLRDSGFKYPRVKADC